MQPTSLSTVKTPRPTVVEFLCQESNSANGKTAFLSL